MWPLLQRLTALATVAAAASTTPPPLYPPLPSGRSDPSPASFFLQGTYPNYRRPAPPVPAITCNVLLPPWNAAGDGATDDTAALQRCIDRCGTTNAAGDVTSSSATTRSVTRPQFAAVLLPRNRSFVTGALNLTSRLVLRVEGALLASTDPAQYPVVPALQGYGVCRDNTCYPGGDCHGPLRHQALLSGWGLADVWVDGGGTGVIDGRALTPGSSATTGNTSWVQRFRAGTLDFGRPRIYEPMLSARVALVNVSVRNQAFWAVHPYACDDVYVGWVDVSAPRDEGINNDDGFDPDSCNRVLVENSIADVGDNSVAVKSGMDRSGRAFGRPAANTVFRGCAFVCETFAVGSEMSGGVVNLTVEGSSFGGGGSDFAGIHLKTQRGRGGAVRGLMFRDLDIDLTNSTKQPFAFSASMFYSGPHPPPPTNASATPEVSGVRVENVRVRLPAAPGYARGVFAFEGLPESPLRDFAFADVFVVAGATTATGDAAWSCNNATHGFTFSGKIEPRPGPTCNHSAWAAAATVPTWS